MMDSGERTLLEATVRDAIGSVRADAGASALDAVLADLGWLEMLDAEPSDAIDIVFTALGATNGTASVLDDVVVAALGTTPRADLAFLLPRFGAWDPPGRTGNGHVSALGIAGPRTGTATDMVVVCAGGRDLCAVTVPISAADVSAVRGVDPDAGFHVVRVEGDAAVATPIDESAWESVTALGRRAVAHEIAGASRTMLELARAHALERVQFGRAVARFQAVRHRLAEALVAIEALDAVLTAAADTPGPGTAALAKAFAGQAARTVAAHSQQVLAGIGFTTDHPFHRYLKRTMLLEGVFGRADEIVLDFGHQLLAARTVPTLIDL